MKVIRVLATVVAVLITPTAVAYALVRWLDDAWVDNRVSQRFTNQEVPQ